MTHLYIEQNTGLTEEVNASIIAKLYELAISGDLDETSDLKGRLHSPLSYRTLVLYLNTNYSDLHISVDDYAIPFEDPNVVTYLNSIGVGSNGMITEAQAAAATVVANSTNTTITKFNELKYFTNITESKGGFNNSGVGKIRFSGWTALEEVDISNLTSIGHNNGYGWEDTFANCSSLKKVTASNNLTKIGYNAFYNCQKLDTFTGLEGTVEVYDFAFFNCKKLPQSFFQPLSFLIKGVSGEPSNFASCNLLESITVAEGTTTIPAKCFRDCPKLSTVTLPSTIISIGNLAFYGCDKLSTINIPSGNITIGLGAFQVCTSLTSVDLSNCTSIGANAFNGCTSLTNIGTDLSNCTYISYDNVFYNCPITNDIVIQGQDFANNNPLGAGSFIGTRIRSLTVKNNLNVSTRLFGGRNSGNKSAFGDNPNLLFVDLSLSGLTTASTSGYTFDNDSSLKWVKYPESFIKFGKSEFSRCTSLEAVVLPAQQVVESVISLNSYGAYTEMHSLWNTGMQQPSMLRLYVPDSLINDYKLHYAWSEYADIIKPMSELPDLLAMISST